MAVRASYRQGNMQATAESANQWRCAAGARFPSRPRRAMLVSGKVAKAITLSVTHNGRATCLVNPLVRLDRQGKSLAHVLTRDLKNMRWACGMKHGEEELIPKPFDPTVRVHNKWRWRGVPSNGGGVFLTIWR